MVYRYTVGARKRTAIDRTLKCLTNGYVMTMRSQSGSIAGRQNAWECRAKKHRRNGSKTGLTKRREGKSKKLCHHGGIHAAWAEKKACNALWQKLGGGGQLGNTNEGVLGAVWLGAG
eukprot:scaffold17263_cov30-Prasinocladus_malaysianus.AAC.1